MHHIIIIYVSSLSYMYHLWTFTLLAFLAWLYEKCSNKHWGEHVLFISSVLISPDKYLVLDLLPNLINSIFVLLRNMKIFFPILAAQIYILMNRSSCSLSTPSPKLPLFFIKKTLCEVFFHLCVQRMKH